MGTLVGSRGIQAEHEVPLDHASLSVEAVKFRGPWSDQ